MDALLQAQNAYRSESQPIRTDRGTEYEIFARITHRLRQAAAKAKGVTPALATAVHDNRRLWAMLAADVAGDGNRLPAELRARIVYLAEFTRTYSSRILNGASADPLIEINSSMMSGLRQRSKET